MAGRRKECLLFLAHARYILILSLLRLDIRGTGGCERCSGVMGPSCIILHVLKDENTIPVAWLQGRQCLSVQTEMSQQLLDHLTELLVWL